MDPPTASVRPRNIAGVWRRFLAAFLCAAVLFAAIVAVLYQRDVQHQRALLEQEAIHVVDLQQELLETELRTVQSDVLFLASQKALRQFLSGDDAQREALEQQYVNFALAKGVYDQVRCLDQSGRESIRVNFRDGVATVVPPDQLQSKVNRYYFQQSLGLARGEVFVSPFDLNFEHGQIEQPIKPVIRFCTPVVDESGERRGLLVLNYLGATLLARLEQVAAGFRGEMMLVNPAGEYLQSPYANREWGWLLGHEQSFRTDFPAAWRHARDAASDQRRLGDDLFTFRRVAPGVRTAIGQSGVAAQRADFAGESLLLAARVSSSVATAHSRALLYQLLLLYACVMIVVAVLSIYWARSRQLRSEQERRIVDSESRLRQLSSQLLAAQETERRNLSRDLHDDLGQQATAVSLDLRSLEKSSPEAASSPLLRRAINEVDGLLKTLHEIARRVRPRVLDDLGLHDAVESLIEEYQRRTGVEVAMRLQFDRERIPPAIGENVFRILQEALANVAAHAGAHEAEVILETGLRQLRMTVSDPGAGFDPEEKLASKRLGLLGMRERAELLNGRFELESQPGAGTSVRVRIPLPGDESTQ